MTQRDRFIGPYRPRRLFPYVEASPMPVVPAAHVEHGTSRFHKFLPLNKGSKYEDPVQQLREKDHQDPFEKQRQAVEDYIFGKQRPLEEVYDPMAGDWMYEYL